MNIKIQLNISCRKLATVNCRVNNWLSCKYNDPVTVNCMDSNPATARYRYNNTVEVS